MIEKFYKKKQNRKNLFIGMLWLVFAFLGFIFQENYSLRWFDYGWMALAVLHFALYFFEHKMAYVTITDSAITRYSPFAKRLAIGDIVDIKKQPTNYIIKSKTKELTINPEYINDKDLVKLNLFLDGMRLKTT